MSIAAAIGARWNAFWRGANALALALDADPLSEIHSRIGKLEAEVFGASPAATVGRDAGPASSHHKEPST
jgi:hypothetical protein